MHSCFETVSTKAAARTVIGVTTRVLRCRKCVDGAGKQGQRGWEQGAGARLDGERGGPGAASGAMKRRQTNLDPLPDPLVFVSCVKHSDQNLSDGMVQWSMVTVALGVW